MLFFGRNQRAGDPGRGRHQFRAGVEAMEGRALLTASGASIVLSNGMIQVIGTNLGDTGSVTLQGGAVHVKLSNAQGSDDVAFPAAQVGSVYYVGGSGDNVFSNTTSLTGYLYGGSGNNVLTGGSGVDYLIATGHGTEVLNAGSGYEILESLGSGTNTLNGGSGYTTMVAVAGNNTLHGGSGFSSIITYGGHNSIDGGAGTSYVYSFVSTDVIAPNNREVVYHIGY